MAQIYNISASGSEFKNAREKFESIVSWLGSAEAMAQAHGAVEVWLEQSSREMLRRMFQGHLEVRAHQEKRLPAAEGSDGVIRTHVRNGERGLMSVFGPVRVPRLQYGGRGASSLFPADAVLNLPIEEHSHGLRRHVAEEAARGSFEETVSAIARYTGGHVAKRQAEALARRGAGDFDAFYEQRAASGPEKSDDLLVMSLDGKGIVMRTEDLREATRQAAEQSQPKLEKRLSSGEKANRKRMATVATVYSLVAKPRTASEVMKELAPVHAVPRPRPYNKRVWASVTKTAEEVTEEAFQEALRRDPEHCRPWVVLVDGDPHQLDRIFACSERHNVDPIVVLDFIHVLEYLWDAAWCFYTPGDPQAEQWVTDRAISILEGRSSDVAAGIRRSATLRKLTGEKRKTVDRSVDYMHKHRPMLCYDIALREGWPIASGVIEGACRYLVKDRMEITGARWGLKSAEAVLKLRALRTSGDLDEYWDFHLGLEQERNHLSRYARGQLARAA